MWDDVLRPPPLPMSIKNPSEPFHHLSPASLQHPGNAEEPKVCDHHFAVVIEDVLGLEVLVKDSLGVEVAHALQGARKWDLPEET